MKLIGYHGDEPVYEVAAVTPGGLRINLLGQDIWLDVCDAAITGVCLGVGASTLAAVDDAIRETHLVAATLQRVRDELAREAAVTP